MPRPAFRLAPTDSLPVPHEPFKCEHAGRFTSIQEAGETADRASVGARFLASLTTADRSRCHYHQADWLAIGQAAERIFHRLGAQVDSADVLDEIEREGLANREALWLHSLFADPMGVSRANDRFINGQHRACALRFSSISNVVLAD